ncbi:hypothetical protein [Roseomonas elaeocarpi]|uniref:Uncharacterized protein n=1 Tax=Roseomonas elaeocarpi TaxID=907779 RepID=A0ABV6JSQ4_9PROT
MDPALQIGGFVVDRRGRLRPHRPQERPALRFRWRGHDCTAVLGPKGLELSARAGEIPSTVSAAERRGAVIRAIDALPRDLPPDWTLSLSPSHALWLDAARAVEAPTATRLIAEMVRFALALDPYLDRLSAAGLEGTPST